MKNIIFGFAVLLMHSAFAYKITLFNDTPYEVNYRIDPAPWNVTCGRSASGSISSHKIKVIDGNDVFGKNNAYLRPATCCISRILVSLSAPDVGDLFAEYRPVMMQCRNLTKHIKIKNSILVLE